MDNPLNNFYQWYKKYILNKNLKEESCMGCYMVEKKEVILSFKAIAIKIGGPYVIVMN